MLEPAPTTAIDPRLARGTVVDHLAATATTPEFVVIGFPNTGYKMHLQPLPAGGAAGATEVGRKVIGRIRADARRVDVVTSGGRFVEPIFGRPRRVQGSVIDVDPAANTITVHAGVPILCRLTDARQRADRFSPGQFVSFDVLRGATFEPAAD